MLESATAPDAAPTPPDPATPPLLEAADHLVNELTEAAPAALQAFDADAIHKARVATRRLSAICDLVRPLTSKRARKGFTRVLRKLRRRLGALRDFDVMLAHLEDLGTDPRSVTAVSRLTSHLQEQRGAERARVLKKNPTSRVLRQLALWQDLRPEINAATEAIDSLLGQQLHTHLHAFDAHASTLPAADLKERSDPHEVRIDGKRLRYTLELAGIQDHAVAAKTMRAFKKMQEELGQWHDHIVLGAAAAKLARHLLEREHDATGAAAMYELSARTLKIAAKHLDGFSKRWAARGDSIRSGIRAIFPLTRDLTVSQMDLDPSGFVQTPPPAIPEIETSPMPPA